jgi:phosphatidylglycerophosphatase A
VVKFFAKNKPWTDSGTEKNWQVRDKMARDPRARAQTIRDKKMNKLLNFFATGFGLGRSPFAPGTVGTLPGIPLAWALSFLAWPWQVAACAALALLAIPLCSVGEKAAGAKDPHCVVADEYLTFPITLIGLPFAWPVVVFAFLTHRALDILKPYPARQLQALPGGLGITIDDVFSSLYALACNHLAYQLALHFGWL